jgi:CPA1 family monovalent cation:H+ antiporter
MNFIPNLAGPISSITQVEIAVIIGLLIITLVAILVRRVNIPYTVALVLAGLALALARSYQIFDFQIPDQAEASELILALFVPLLVFEGALHINWRSFKLDLIPILLLAVAGVLVAMFIVGGVILGINRLLELAAGVFDVGFLGKIQGIPFLAALAFGALIAATDPVAVIAFFRTLGVDKRLSQLMEGESLFNDGTSIVIFKLALAIGGVTAAASGEAQTGFSFSSIVWNFISVAVGGLVVGLLVGVLADVAIYRNLDNMLVETTITLPVAFGSYILAEQFHLSGILAVVAAGIYLGNRIPIYTTPSTKIALYNFWEILSYVATSLIFLVIGFQIDVRQFFSVQIMFLVLSAVIAILVARAMVIYGMSAFSRRLGTAIQRKYQHVMFWGGLRGAISLALALSLGVNDFGPGIGEQLRLMTFGVVLFTLIVQGTTIKPLIKRLGLAEKSRRQNERERSLGRFYTSRAAQKELDRLNEMGVVSGSILEAMQEAQRMELEERDQNVREMLQRHPGLSVDLTLQVRRAMLQAERMALGEAARSDLISVDTFEQMMEELDCRVEALNAIEDQTTSPVFRFVDKQDEG